ncbi:hypothetical protein BU14_0051s0046 [Porphyra umbilicalis]|uniref:Hedgehog protein Hint domain-containing protein n=1 Tax=Porphyra umbilicalis TaxID=2786 RepID=A0A1X6PIF7_PORUM|nr:hypothetical protein BU14_0051s0046 [Porphyra umbilicalis]|eukprot:OSX80526.1 hypothetical protein BU14_0051s0046 [Porphyra umbilicalis]
MGFLSGVAAAAAAAATVGAAAVGAFPLSGPTGGGRVAAVPDAAVPATARAFEGSMLRNSRYTRFIRQGNCPTRVAIGAVSNVAPGVFTVPHGSITSDSTSCTSASAMTVVPSSSGVAGDLEALLAADDILDATFKALNAAGASFLVGFENQQRVCGRGRAATQPAPAVTLFINEDAGVAIPSVAFLRPTPGGYMVVFTPSAGERIPCTYAAARDGVAADTGVVDDEAGGGVDEAVAAAGGAGGGGRSGGEDDDDAADATGEPAETGEGGPAAVAAVAVPAAVPVVPAVPAEPAVPVVPVVPVRVAPPVARVAAQAAAALGERRTTMTMTIRRPLRVPAAARAAAARVAAAPVVAARAAAVRVVAAPVAAARAPAAAVAAVAAPALVVAAPALAAGDDDDDTIGAGDDDDDDDLGGADAEDDFPTPTPTDEDNPDTNGDGFIDAEESAAAAEDDSVCFPADATVELESGAVVAMAALAVGDVVRVAPGSGAAAFSPVYFFSHKDPPSATAAYTYVTLTTAAGAAVTLTPGHYVYANGVRVAAGAVPVGATLTLASGAPSPVTGVTVAVRRGGLYNPHTLVGDVVVNGVLSSTYTTAVHPVVAAGLLAPLRAAWRASRVGGGGGSTGQPPCAASPSRRSRRDRRYAQRSGGGGRGRGVARVAFNGGGGGGAGGRCGG